MAALTEPRVGIVGLGAIGGSAALALLDRGLRPRGFSNYPGDVRAGAEAGVEVVGSVAELVNGCDLVLLAVPLDVIATVAAQVVDAGDGHAPRPSIFHAGSLQRREAIRGDAEVVAHVIGTHPIAGTHGVGFAAAAADMFRGATVSVESRANARQRADAELLWSLLGAGQVTYDTAEDHDRRMAWVSHVPQLTATAVASTLSRAHCRAGHLGPGGRDVTRLAESSLAVWLPILDRAPHETVQGLAALERAIAGMRELIERRDWTSLSRLWEEARRWRAESESKQ